METKVETGIRRRFTVKEYHRTAEAGILHEDDRVELIGGETLESAALPALVIPVDAAFG